MQKLNDRDVKMVFDQNFSYEGSFDFFMILLYFFTNNAYALIRVSSTLTVTLRKGF